MALLKVASCWTQVSVLLCLIFLSGINLSQQSTITTTMDVNTTTMDVNTTTMTDTTGMAQSTTTPTTLTGGSSSSGFNVVPVLGGVAGLLLLLVIVVLIWIRKARNADKPPWQEGEAQDNVMYRNPVFEKQLENSDGTGSLKQGPVLYTELIEPLPFSGDTAPPSLPLYARVGNQDVKYVQLEMEAANQALKLGQTLYVVPPTTANKQDISTPRVAWAGAEHEDVYGNADSILQSVVIPSSQITFGERIDGGQFGDVFIGQLLSGSESKLVALKALKLDHQSDKERHEFLRGWGLDLYDFLPLLRNDDHGTAEPSEYHAAIGSFNRAPVGTGHGTHGYVRFNTYDGDQEYVPDGSLHRYMRSRPQASLPVVLLMGQQIASGLAYMHDRNVVHGDMAARNVLLRIDGSHFCCKITDLGLSRVTQGVYTHDTSQILLPIRWTALEVVFHGRTSQFSDVWSFGVTLFELTARCELPYAHLRNNDDVIDSVEKGHRLHQAPGVPDELYDLMLRCWQDKPEDRPHFSELVKTLQAMVSASDVAVLPDCVEDNADDEFDATLMALLNLGDDETLPKDVNVYVKYLQPETIEYVPFEPEQTLEPDQKLYYKITTDFGTSYELVSQDDEERPTELYVKINRKPSVVFKKVEAGDVIPPGQLWQSSLPRDAQLAPDTPLTPLEPEPEQLLYSGFVPKHKRQSGRESPILVSGSQTETQPPTRPSVSGKLMPLDPPPSRPSVSETSMPAESPPPRPAPDSQASPIRPTTSTSPVVQVDTDQSQTSSAAPPLKRRVRVEEDFNNLMGALEMAGLEDVSDSEEGQFEDADFERVTGWLALPYSLSRDEAEAYLGKGGQSGHYLVRQRKDPQKVAVSVRCDTSVYHYRITIQDSGQAQIMDVVELPMYDSLRELINESRTEAGHLKTNLVRCLDPPDQSSA